MKETSVQIWIGTMDTNFSIWDCLICNYYYTQAYVASQLSLSAANSKIIFYACVYSTGSEAILYK